MSARWGGNLSSLSHRPNVFFRIAAQTRGLAMDVNEQQFEIALQKWQELLRPLVIAIDEAEDICGEDLAIYIGPIPESE